MGISAQEREKEHLWTFMISDWFQFALSILILQELRAQIYPQVTVI